MNFKGNRKSIIITLFTIKSNIAYCNSIVPSNPYLVCLFFPPAFRNVKLCLGKHTEIHWNDYRENKPFGEENNPICIFIWSCFIIKTLKIVKAVLIKSWKLSQNSSQNNELFGNIHTKSMAFASDKILYILKQLEVQRIFSFFIERALLSMSHLQRRRKSLFYKTTAKMLWIYTCSLATEKLDVL